MMVDGIDGVRMEGDEEIKYYWKKSRPHIATSETGD